MALNIPVILGTAREGRRSEHAARYVLAKIKEAGHVTELIDVRDYRLRATDATGASPEAKRYSKKIAAADALVIVSPEYNHGYPGELKMMLDLVYKVYSGKPVGICGVSDGPWGGTRMIEQLRLVAVAVGMNPAQRAVMFADVDELFGDDGVITEDRRYAKGVAGLLEELVRNATASEDAGS